jgi:hypothetical protein
MRFLANGGLAVHHTAKPPSSAKENEFTTENAKGGVDLGLASRLSANRERSTLNSEGDFTTKAQRGGAFD